MWLTTEEAMAQKCIADYIEIAINCGGIDHLEKAPEQEAFLHGWWMANRMGNACPETVGYFQDQLNIIHAGRTVRNLPTLVSGDTDG